MADPNTPVAVNEIVQFAVQFVAEAFSASKCPVTGPRLANAIRERYPSLSYPQLGLTRLVDVVVIAEKQGLLQRRKDVTHLELFPGLASISQAVSTSRTQHETQMRYVRPEFWKALVFVRTNVLCFFDRVTAQVIEFSPTSNADLIRDAEADKRFIKLEAIAPHIQQEWMRAFLESADITDAASAPITSERWWTDFPAWLRSRNSEMEFRWRAYRVRSVVAYARSWAEQHDVSINAVMTAFDPQWAGPRPAKLEDKSRRPETQALSQAPAFGSNSSDEQDVRGLFLSILGKMPLEELGELAIPMKYMLHIRSR